MSKAQELPKRGRGSFVGTLRRMGRAGTLKVCEHGHLECSPTERGACSDEVLGILEASNAAKTLTRGQQRVLDQVQRCGTSSAWQVSTDLGISPYWAMQHLEVLERHGLVAVEETVKGAYEWPFTYRDGGSR